jgi:poly-gamma-glutamate capsule biosynthesis protein CapA/YwtB (metallophosphatase superfamily)
MMIVIDKSKMKKGVVYSGDDVTQSTEDAVAADAQASKGTTSARLMCAGDNLIHGSIYKQANKRAGSDGYDFSYAYDSIKSIIGKSDVAFINQETVMDPDNEPSSYPLFNSPSELLGEMTSLGFNVFNQATNHVMDQGLSGAKADIKLFKSKGDSVILTGLYDTWDDMLKPETKTVNNITFSFVGFSEYLNGLVVPSDSDLGLVYLTDTRHTQDELYSTMKQMIENAKKSSDIVCVSMHWKTEDITEPNDAEKNIVSKLLEYGADVVIGTGPHVLQPIEYKQNGDGEQALVIWSLGNFISCQSKVNNLLGGIADVTVSKDLDTNKTSVSSAKLIPTITQYTSSYGNVHIVPLSAYTEDMASEHGINDSESGFTLSYINKYYSNMFGDKLEATVS